MNKIQKKNIPVKQKLINIFSNFIIKFNGIQN